MWDQIRMGVHGCIDPKDYIAPKEPEILEKIEWFRDQKLALMMHFGPYSQMGLDCSWPLSREDAWAREDVDWESDFETLKEQYISLNKSFNPIKLNPEKLADFAKENGFKYLIFTTKHHDGFCMWDTKYSDYKITAPDCPFHTHKYSDIVKNLFSAFRERGLGIGAYFSKPDWHCPWYWAKGMEIPHGENRYPTYEPTEHPELWEKFVEFTHNQVLELVGDYGKLDILWFDGGWCKPSRRNQDIKMASLVKKARAITPDLLTVDRISYSEYENYITMEQSVPTTLIEAPWESCVTLGRKWMYRTNEMYKSARSVIRMLIEVVCRGGNLALNVGPQPDGQLPHEAVKIISELGAWLKVNGDAIYKTRPCEICESGNVKYTRRGDTVYAIIPFMENETLSESVFIPTDKDVKRISCLGIGECRFEKAEGGYTVAVPEQLVNGSPYAITFSLEG